MKKLLSLIMLLFLSTIAFSQVINDKIFIEILDEDYNKKLMVRPVPTSDAEWRLLTDYLISIMGDFRDGMVTMYRESQKMDNEVKNIERESEVINVVIENVEKQEETLTQLENEINKKKFELFYGVTGEYTFLSRTHYAVGLGAGFRWMRLSLTIVPTLFLNDAQPYFGFGARISWWF